MILPGASCCFDITVEELKSFVGTQRFLIKSQFADIFSLVLKTPEKSKLKRKRRKVTIKDTSNSITSAKNETHKGQAILFKGNIDYLRSHMMKYPMELHLCLPSDPDQEVGSALVPWNPGFIEYLMMSTYHKTNPSPPTVSNVHNVFHVATSKKIASLRLTVKLHLVENVNWSDYTVLSRMYPNIFVLRDQGCSYVPLCNKHFKNQATSTIQLCHDPDHDPGVIKTIYSGGKRKKRRASNKSSNINKNMKEKKHTKEENKPTMDQGHNKNVNTTNFNLTNFIRSDTDTTKVNKLDLIHSKSCTAINSFNHGDTRRGVPFGNNIYTVGYFSVENVISRSPSQTGSVKSHEQIKTPSKASDNSSHGKISDSLDTALTRSVKCENVKCEHKKGKPMLEVPDDRTLLDLTNVTRTCCLTETMKSKMEIIGVVPGDHMHPASCYCACECSFNFEKKTTYCEICKGYEKLAEDLDGKPQHMLPIPCPIYHKLSKTKGTGSTSGSESKKDTKKRGKGPEKKKKNDDSRFKFQYGYKAPQIGHDQCVNTCAGPLSNVPKNMGWLWTADNVPGLMVAQGWRPGAVSYYILRLLKRAKLNSAHIVDGVPVKKSKKKCKNKPTLIISKKEGEYTVEMQVTAAGDPNCIQHDPLVYKIAPANLQEKIERRERNAKRLIDNLIKEFDDPFHPEQCQKTCLRSYKEVLGLGGDVEKKMDDNTSVENCSRDDDEVSNASSLDVDWEIHFSPPKARIY